MAASRLNILPGGHSGFALARMILLGGAVRLRPPDPRSLWPSLIRLGLRSHLAFAGSLIRLPLRSPRHG